MASRIRPATLRAAAFRMYYCEADRLWDVLILTFSPDMMGPRLPRRPAQRSSPEYIVRLDFVMCAFWNHCDTRCTFASLRRTATCCAT